MIFCVTIIYLSVDENKAKEVTCLIVKILLFDESLQLWFQVLMLGKATPPIIVAEIIAFIKPKMMSHELPYIYTILGHLLTRIVCYLVNILKCSSEDMYLLCNLNFLHNESPNPCRTQLLSLLFVCL